MLIRNQSTRDGSSSEPFLTSDDRWLSLSLAPPNAQSRYVAVNPNPALEASASRSVPAVGYELLQAPQRHSRIQLGQMRPAQAPEQSASLAYFAEASSSTAMGVMASVSNPHKRLYPEAGAHQNAPRKKQKQVDPETGQPSQAHNAIPISTFQSRQKVDPETGKLSQAHNAISKAAFQKRKKVDPVTGKPSQAHNAIPMSTFQHRQKVDPVTGKLSQAHYAISKSTFHKRQKVDPETGEPSHTHNAIPKTTFQHRQKVDPVTGKPSSATTAIPRSTFYRKKIS